MTDYMQKSEQIKQNIFTHCNNAQTLNDKIDLQYSEIRPELEKVIDDLNWVYKVVSESEQAEIVHKIYDCIKRVELSLSILSKYDAAQLSDIYNLFIQLDSGSASAITGKDHLNEFSIYENMNMIDDEASLTEGNINSLFANNIDKDILDVLNGPYDAPVTNNFVKCSKSVVPNALYYVSQGEDVEFCLGNINSPYRQITHCWIVHNGKIVQTRVPTSDVKLIKKFSIDLVPNDVEESIKKIRELITSI